MSVYVKDMDMPSGCLSCDFCNPFTDEPYCQRLMKTTPKGNRLKDCPIVPEAPAQRWIPVSERLPEPNVDVLVCVKRGNRMDIDLDFLDDRGKFDAPNVTHWAPVPEPPEEVQ